MKTETELNQEFADIWNNALSLGDAAGKLRMTRKSCSIKANRLRGYGWQLKSFGNPVKVLQPNVNDSFVPACEVPESPTDAAPGSVDKVRVLGIRADRGEPLWHPEDTLYCDSSKDTKYNPPMPYMPSPPHVYRSPEVR